MSHRQYREQLPLLLYQELSEEEKNVVEAHVHECVSCQQELAQLKQIQGMAAGRRQRFLTEEFLEQNRRRLRETLRQERSKESFWERWNPMLWPPLYKTALGAAFSLVVGLLIGYFTFSSRPVAVTSESRQGFERGEIQITNIRFEDADAADGEVEFSFDSVTPMRIKGSITDPRVQKVLTYAMVNEQNPGIRLRAVSAFSTQPLNSPDAEIKNALITTLKTDENPGVRKEALSVLQKLPVDQQIKESLLYVLTHDKNPGLRVAAIKSLEASHLKDQDVLNVLKQRIQKDDNDYIRLKARAVLREVNQTQ
jgi:hypothetical protein